MSKLITNSFKINTINNLIESSSRYFIFLGRHTAFDDDSIPPTLIDNTSTTYINVYDEMIAAKAIEKSTDISFLISRNDWTSNTIYYRYDQNADLYDKAFYVNVDSGSGQDVFKCLNNAGGQKSTISPDLSQTSASDDIYETADGYQWKYMYSITNNQFNKFATSTLIPVLVNANVVANAINGSVDYIDISYKGSNYNAYANGTLQAVAVGGNTQIYTLEATSSSNSNFYNGSAIKIISGTGAGEQRIIDSYSVSGLTKQIVINTPFDTTPTTSSTYEISPNVIIEGNGTGFKGRGIINSTSNSIHRVEITQRGNNYTFGTVTFNGNTGGVTNTAIGKVIISPTGGHGSNAAKELGAHYMGISTTFNTSDATSTNKIFDVNDFRIIGIIDNPLLANIELTYTGSVGTFSNNEIINQANTLASGLVTFANSSILRLTNVSSNNNFLPGNATFGIITGANTATTAQVISVKNNGSANLSANVTYINQTTLLYVSTVTGTFLLDEIVTGTGNTATSNAILYKANSSIIHITNVKGSFGNTITGANSGATASITSIQPGDFVVGSGDIFYLENLSPINKTAGQTEKIKIIIEF